MFSQLDLIQGCMVVEKLVEYYRVFLASSSNLKRFSIYKCTDEFWGNQIYVP